MNINSFKAFIVENNDDSGKLKTVNGDYLMNGDVLVEVKYSSFNYKDGLALSGKIPIFKRYPMIPGVDLSGKVIESTHKRFKKNDLVVLNGWGIGESHHGGFAEFARVSGEWLIHLPNKFSEKDAMIIGSAGYTAALCVLEIIKNIKPNNQIILVSGASGGVGSIAVYILAKIGYEVHAISGKDESFLKKLGAKKIIHRNDFEISAKPLQKQKFSGAIDTVGGEILSTILSQTEYDGTVVCTGMAQSHKLVTTVFPFILRNISLIGVDSVYTKYDTRIEAWNLLEKYVDLELLQDIKSEKNLNDLTHLSKEIMNGKIQGRTVIKI